MSERIPTTDEVRDWAAYIPKTSVDMEFNAKDAAAFDRWLEQHDQEVLAAHQGQMTDKARREFADALVKLFEASGLRAAAATTGALVKILDMKSGEEA